MDRYRIYAQKTVSMPVMAGGKPIYEDVEVPGVPVMVGGKEVQTDPTTENRQKFVDLPTAGDVVAKGELSGSDPIAYKGSEPVHHIAIYAGPEDEEQVVGVMSLDGRQGPFEVDLVLDKD